MKSRLLIVIYAQHFPIRTVILFLKAILSFDVAKKVSAPHIKPNSQSPKFNEPSIAFSPG